MAGKTAPAEMPGGHLTFKLSASHHLIFTDQASPAFSVGLLVLLDSHNTLILSQNKNLHI
jgi:hypothetical protein